ncbi:MAG: HAMP domain-containing histidine kinase [Spirochaetales bacterium]|nr:HAMP domain-containing histidine kinase [Spirochaetales bacterium]
MLMIFRSFYAKLSLIFLFLILILGGVTLFITFSAAGHLFDEVEQLLNREYAASIALEIQPLVEEGFFEELIKDAIHYMMVLNPMVEIYLIDSTGEILAYFTHPAESLNRLSIDLSPIRTFVESSGLEPVLGDDPRSSQDKKPFSAAPLRMGNSSGYVYVILRGQSYDKSLEMLRNSYYIKTGFRTFLLAFIIALAVGLSLFFLITRRLRYLHTAVKTFQIGEYNHRVDLGGSDELGDLGRAFNEMAFSIEAGVEKLREAEQQRSDLITNISHDLRSPLTSVRGHLETVLLKDDKISPEERRNFLETSLKSVSSFQKLVEELFELVKLETSQVRPGIEPFQIAELAQDVVLKLKPRAVNSGVSLIIEQPGNLPVFHGDIGLIERLLSNLLENAVTHTPSGGMVKITVEVQDEVIKIVVSDTGSGISSEDLPHIFERFYRGDKSRDRGVPGTGLGLAIAREIVGLHKGSIEVQSPADSGAVFTIYLPMG